MGVITVCLALMVGCANGRIEIISAMTQTVHTFTCYEVMKEKAYSSLKMLNRKGLLSPYFCFYYPDWHQPTLNPMVK